MNPEERNALPSREVLILLGMNTARVPLLPAAKQRAEGVHSPRAVTRERQARRGDPELANPRESHTMPSLGQSQAA